MDIQEITAAHQAAGLHFFDVGAKRFFKSRVGSTVYEGPGGIYFVTSEQFGQNPRRYTVRRFDPKTKHVRTAGDFCKLSRADAVALARKLAKG